MWKGITVSDIAAFDSGFYAGYPGPEEETLCQVRCESEFALHTTDSSVPFQTISPRFSRRERTPTLMFNSNSFERIGLFDKFQGSSEPEFRKQWPIYVDESWANEPLFASWSSEAEFISLHPSRRKPPDQARTSMSSPYIYLRFALFRSSNALEANV